MPEMGAKLFSLLSFAPFAAADNRCSHATVDLKTSEASRGLFWSLFVQSLIANT